MGGSGRRIAPPWAVFLSAAVAALLALQPASAQPVAARPALGAEYVALGSSFAAGPGVAARAEDAPEHCSQSADDYAHLLARKRGLSLADRSCSATTTADVLRPGKFSLPAQIDALGPATRLVTVTTGGNDVAYIGNLYAWSCEERPEVVPAFIRKPLCTPTPDRVVEQRLDALGPAMLQIAEAVHARAPRAQLVFLDYTTVLPDAGTTCSDRLPLSAARLERGRAVATRLARITADAAAEGRASLIRVSALTRGHDVCATDPWVSPWTFSVPLTSFSTVAYHPTSMAMQAIAAALDARLPPTLSGANENGQQTSPGKHAE